MPKPEQSEQKQPAPHTTSPNDPRADKARETLDQHVKNAPSREAADGAP